MIFIRFMAPSKNTGRRMTKQEESFVDAPDAWDWLRRMTDGGKQVTVLKIWETED